MPENNVVTQKDGGLPNSENCRARNHDSWNDGLVDCLIENPLCNFSLNFGGLPLCLHPRRKEIVERTKSDIK